MTMLSIQSFLAVLVAAMLAMPIGRAKAAERTLPKVFQWPSISMTAHPWTRWWWLGSAVDEKNLRELLQQYHDAGIGGVEICPIYGAKGYESRYIQFLSPEWTRMLAVTTRQAKTLGMGVDLTDGTGWPFGGPWVSAKDSSSRVVLKKYDAPAGQKLNVDLPHGQVRCIMAFDDHGHHTDLTALAHNDQIQWTPPAGNWTVYAVLEQGPIQKVKRSAPGGEGDVLDPFSVSAMHDYLAKFDQAFKDFNAPMPRAHFHDSYEYYGADWTPEFFEDFQKRRGYDLRLYLPALFGDAPSDTVARVMHDYRQTIAELHLAYISIWTDWTHGKHGLSREQAHGAPANILDVYAAADIPETEVAWKTPIEQQAPMMKFATSAAHVTGKPLASAESFTWAGEHFQVSLADVKPTADFLFCSGVNHIFFHGMPYSPGDVPWPGWLFYAAVNFGPEGGLWHDLPAFTSYIARCQSILQSGKPANDLLLYFPVDDIWQTPGRHLIIQFTTPGEWMWDQPFYADAMMLWKRGFSFDEVSDDLLANAKSVDGRIVLGSNSYQAIVVPACHLMPVKTIEKLEELAAQGGKIVVDRSLPTDVPGLANLASRRAEFQKTREQLQPLVRIAGNSDTDNLEQALAGIGVRRETMVDSGLLCIRRLEPDGYAYFITNRDQHEVHGWVPLAITCKSAVILDPLFDHRSGLAAVRQRAGVFEIYLQIPPGKSYVVRTLNREVSGAAWKYFQPAGPAIEVEGDWHVHFLEGGPKLPADFTTRRLDSWTKLGDSEAKRFAGTARYTLQFQKPSGNADDFRLLLGKVCESARVKLNGVTVGTVWSEPFQIRVGKFLRDGQNTLEIDVTNLAANRIADMDRRGVKWKSFHEINFVNREYQPFDASDWPERDSGLLGPVQLIPLAQMKVVK